MGLEVTWSDCGDASAHGHVSALEPPTITTGEVTTLSGTGSVDMDVAGGSFHLVMKAGVIKLLDHTGDICSADHIDLPLGVGSIDWKGLNCPVSSGAVTVDMDMNLSEKVPSMLLTTSSELTISSSSGDELICVQINTKASEEEVMV